MSFRSDRTRWPPAAWRWLSGWTMRTRLVVGLLALFTAASAGVAAATTLALQDFLFGRLDQQLTTAAGILGTSIEHPPPGPGQRAAAANSCRGGAMNPSLAFGQSVGTFAARLVGGRLSYACVVTATGGHPGLSAVRLSPADLAVFARLPRDDRPASDDLSRLGDYRLTAFIGPDGDVHITGLPLRGVQDTVRRLEVIEVVVFGSALLVMGLAGTAFIRVSLRLLGRITDTAAQISDLPLGSGEVVLPHRVPPADPRTEVGRLGRAFNQMLGHVEAALAKRQASEARLRRFVADASHELRTPLATIRGYTELALRASDELVPAVRSALGKVESESVRMSGLVDDLLLLARLDAGRPLALEAVDLTRLVIDVTADARVAGPRQRWVLDLPKRPVVVTGDQQRLHQVLANLLGNARVHTPPGTTVTVRLTPPADTTVPGGQVVLSITDDGPGIPTTLQVQVWERFVRGDTTRSRRAGSTGLGLAIVHAVVTAHRGTMSLTSRPGETRFSIQLPVAAPKTGDGSAATGGSPLPRRLADERQGLTKARVQQIANTPRSPVLAAFAFFDAGGRLHGNPEVALAGPLMEAPTFGRFNPADKYNPLAGQTLAVQYGPVEEDDWISMYPIQVRQPDGTPLNVRMTRPVQDALYGPPMCGTPERNQWEAAREQRRRELDGT